MLRPADLLIGAAHYAFLNMQNAALFFLPLVLLCVGRLQPADRLKPVRTLIFAIWFIAVAWHLIALGRPIPYSIRGNIFINFALGPATLRDTFVFGMPYPFHIAYGWRIALMTVTTALAIFVAAFLMRNNIAAIYCIAGTVIVMFMRIYFDRYSIDTMWPLAIAIPVAFKDAKVKLAMIPLVLMAVLSTAGTAEYLAWNRARWDAYRWLQSRGVALDQMDGGYEINAMLALRTGQKFLGKPGFGVRDDRYILAFNDVPHYMTLATFPYRRLLGANGVVRAMQRISR